jgi:hypothetical protein
VGGEDLVDLALHPGGEVVTLIHRFALVRSDLTTIYVTELGTHDLLSQNEHGLPIGEVSSR